MFVSMYAYTFMYVNIMYVCETGFAQMKNAAADLTKRERLGHTPLLTFTLVVYICMYV